MTTRPTAERNSNSGDRQIGRVLEPIAEMLKDEANALAVWIVVIVGAFAAFWLSEGTAYHQLTVGVLMSSGTLLVLMAVFEAAWRMIGGR
jgi:hypothetical protein